VEFPSYLRDYYLQYNVEHRTFTAGCCFNVHIPESTYHGISGVKGGVLFHHPTTYLLTLKFLTPLAKLIQVTIKEIYPEILKETLKQLGNMPTLGRSIF
jgi:hypothetical protein